MDHVNAHLLELTAGFAATINIGLKIKHEENNNSPEKSERITHNKEQHQLADYYKQLEGAIKNYEEVLLFGPTDAKLELFNILRADHQYDNIKIGILQADKMTDNQQQAFVREYFLKN